MTEQERNARKEAWDKLGQEKQQQSEKELRELYAWAAEAEDQAAKKIKAEGRCLGGLDGYYPELIEIGKQLKEEIKALQKKYGIID